MMGVTQNWEKASSFPSLCMQVPIPMHTVTYTSSPDTGPVPCPYRLPATPLGPAHILAAAIQDLQGPPHFPPWLQSCPPHHLRRIVPTYLTTESVLPPTAVCLTPESVHLKEQRLELRTRSSPPSMASCLVKIKAESNCLQKASCLLGSTDQHQWWPGRSPVAGASILLTLQQVASTSGEVAQPSMQSDLSAKIVGKSK